MNREMAQVSIQCGGHQDSVVQLSYSRNCESGYYLASAGLDGLAMLRHGDTGLWIDTFDGHQGEVTGVCLNADASILATSSADETARIWNALTGLELKSFTQPGEVTCVQLDGGSTRMVTGCRGSEHYVTVFDVEASDQNPLETFLGHTRGVRNVIFCRDDRALLTSSYDRTVRMWDRQSGQETNSIELPHHAKSLELHPDGKTVTLAYGSSLVFLDVDKFEVLQHRKMGFKVAGATLHPSKDRFICATRNGDIYKYEYSTTELQDIYSLMGVCCVAYSPDGKMCASSSATGQITLWEQKNPSDVSHEPY
ncbi:serine-threonine kinase receptor-associated protein [Drosophila kikkawai]|uniref:Serine-threonine kinase receptor-associated protein n=1 Tax=Drosophila kikkawai TaxID=30033 RepID=A0A6P4IXR2_DROKI|nr:serine-threonine kinase receptor-associated protein [Drosophila kikkawai]